MSELFDFESNTRNMSLELYTGREFPCVVSEPTPSQIIQVENKLSRAKGKDRAKIVLLVGLNHLVSIEDFGIRNNAGKLVPLICDPEAKGFQPDWKKRLARKGVGMKIAALIVSELYLAGNKKSAASADEYGDDLDLGDFEDEGQEPGEKQPAAGAKAEQSGGK